MKFQCEFVSRFKGILGSSPRFRFMFRRRMSHYWRIWIFFFFLGGAVASYFFIIITFLDLTASFVLDFLFVVFPR